ncbi:MAG: hypothetical protein CMH13_11305 [Martelella sp.]|uniref:hypothetical protein n=1 Tax=Martelella sp. TaxID=1969699 RepID=UPI000C3EAC67|nr:hypothetical protein [Martelella sp.]MAU21106.1 hypothetical protein [Martelella sp.]
MAWRDALTTEEGRLALAALAGSAVAAVMEWQGVLPAARRVAVGATAAYFLGPVGVPLFQWAGGLANIPLEPSASVGGFIMGVGGVTIVEFIIKVWHFRLREIDHDKD